MSAKQYRFVMNCLADLKSHWHRQLNLAFEDDIFALKRIGPPSWASCSRPCVRLHWWWLSGGCLLPCLSYRRVRCRHVSLDPHGSDPMLVWTGGIFTSITATRLGEGGWGFKHILAIPLLTPCDGCTMERLQWHFTQPKSINQLQVVETGFTRVAGSIRQYKYSIY